MKASAKIRTDNLSFSYNGKMILRNTTVSFAENEITALVGPSGSGKSTFLMTLNRLWETIPNTTMKGSVEIRFNNRFHNIYADNYPASTLRRQVGTVFQMPNPLPMSIFKNIAFPLRLAGDKDKERIGAKVEQSLKRVRLWDEVKDRLSESALALSGGQQQRMCIARALILGPEILLLDEPTSSLDHKASRAIEQLLLGLKESCTILVVSHYLDQVKRIADTVVELSNGEIVEFLND